MRSLYKTHDIFRLISFYRILVHEMQPEGEPPSGGPVTRSKARRQLTGSRSDSGLSHNELEPRGDLSDQGPASPGEGEQFEILPASDKELGTKTAVFLLLMIFLSSALSMVLVLKTFPDMNDQDKNSIKFPQNLDDAKELGQVLSRYKDQYFLQVRNVRS